jgi:peptide/nickel transport system substrate-binding protein
MEDARSLASGRSAADRTGVAGSRPSRRRVWAVWLVLVALLLGACASEESTSDGPEGTVGDGDVPVVQAGWANETDLEPTTGGTANVTLATPPTSLDPKTASYGLTTEGTVLMALYDNLLRYDPQTGEFEGQLAESIEHNADFSQWTLKLRPNLTFTDGTPLDSAAVVFSIQRLATGRGVVAGFPAFFASFETPDPLTVVMNMVEPMGNVDALLASELGLVVSPTAAQAAGDAFGTNPVGAGPFKLESYNPDAELVLVKNPDYGGGDVRLDGIRFTWSPDMAGNVDKVELGQSDMTFVTEVDLRVRAIEAGMPVLTSPAAGTGLAINSAPDRAFPGDDVRVRQAVAMAVDLDQVNERLYEGHGQLGNFLFPPGSRLHTETPWGVYDPDGARRLVEEVKAETGWDGTARLNTPLPTDLALAMQAQLNAVGFNVQIDQYQSFTQLIDRNIINRDFDLSIWVLSSYETNLWQVLNRSFNSQSRSNWFGFASDEVDALLAELRQAGDDQVVDVLNRLAEVWQREQGYFFAGSQPYSAITTDRIGGMEPTANGLFLWPDVFKA